MPNNTVMDTERSAVIEIGGESYELILTTKATKAIAGKYGGLENLGDQLLKAENFEPALSEIVWLITLLANQSIMIHNLRRPEALLGQETGEAFREVEAVSVADRQVAHTQPVHQ